MSERELHTSVLAIVEQLTRMQLSDTSKNLIVGYLADSTAATAADRAREAIQRYCPAELPTLEEIRARNRAGDRLSALDHLVLKMEYAATQ